MYKTKEMFANGFYLFSGKSSANSSFVEDKEEAMHFIKRCHKKLDGYLEIHDFVICKDGWQLLVELKDEEAIIKLYKKRRKSSRRVKKRSGLQIVWKIISEQLRVILSNYVVYTNRKNGRSGSKVAKSYERYWFESFLEAQRHLDKMRKQMIQMSQMLRKYRPVKNHFRISKMEYSGAIFLCSLNLEQQLVRVFFGDGCLKLIKENLDVLRAAVKKTYLLHKTRNTPQFKPKII